MLRVIASRYPLGASSSQEETTDAHPYMTMPFACFLSCFSKPSNTPARAVDSQKIEVVGPPVSPPQPPVSGQVTGSEKCLPDSVGGSSKPVSCSATDAILAEEPAKAGKPPAPTAVYSSGEYLYQKNSSLKDDLLEVGNMKESNSSSDIGVDSPSAIDGLVYSLRVMTPQELTQEIERLSWLGAGGFGVVYHGYWQGAPVAVKYLVNPHLDLKDATSREALLSKLLGHPNVVQTFVSKSAHLDEHFIGSVTQKAADEGGISTSHDKGHSGGGSFVSGEGFGNPFGNKGRFSSICEVLMQLDAQPGQYLTQIVMEYCDKGSLQKAINRGLFKANSRWNTRLALRALLRTAREIAQGMCHIHKSNVVHGDLKPGNVLLKGSRVDRRGYIAKVSDFGLSHVSFSSAPVDVSSWATVMYMAPEAFDGQLSKASDVYSFGILLWHMYVGERPYGGMHPGEVAAAVHDGTLRPAWPEEAPPKLVALAEKCTLHDWRERPTFNYVMKELTIVESELRMEGRNNHSGSQELKEVSVNLGKELEEPT